MRHAPNLLALHGFSHHRPPPGNAGSPVYILGDGEIVLWGFGLLTQFADQQPIYVNRFCCELRLPRAALIPHEVWLPEHLGTLRVPASPETWRTSLGAMARALRWIASYEDWIVIATAPGYRANCLAHWPRAICPASEMIPAWEQLAEAYEEVTLLHGRDKE